MRKALPSRYTTFPWISWAFYSCLITPIIEMHGENLSSVDGNCLNHLKRRQKVVTRYQARDGGTTCMKTFFACQRMPVALCACTCYVFQNAIQSRWILAPIITVAKK